MTTINIGTSKQNIVGVEIDKPFEEITFKDILKIVKERFGEKNDVMVQGWADVSLEVGDKVRCPLDTIGTLIKIKDIPWGFDHIVRVDKANAFYNKNERAEFKKDQITKR